MSNEREKISANILPHIAKALEGVGNAYKKLDFPTTPLAVGGVFALPYITDKTKSDNYPLNQTFSEAQARGENPMSKVSRSLNTPEQDEMLEKTAGMKPPAAAAGALGDVLKSLFGKSRRTPLKGENLTSKQKDLYERGIGDVVQRAGDEKHFYETHSPAWGRMGLGLGTLGVGGVGYNALTTAPDNPLQHKIQKAVYGPMDLGQMEDEYRKGLALQGGKETSKMVHELLNRVGNRASEEVSSLSKKVPQSRTMNQVMSSDEMLREADPEDKELLQRAYGTMQKFAPELAKDEFAVKNYLRESLMAANGPDYGTISNLARANRDVTEQGRR